jgi:molybdopterin converting factor small subunit
VDGEAKAVITVRFYAAAREAAGCSTLSVSVASTGELRAELSARFGSRMTQILAVASVVSAGRRLTGDEALPPGCEVEILPPFAGG